MQKDEELTKNVIAALFEMKRFRRGLPDMIQALHDLKEMLANFGAPAPLLQQFENTRRSCVEMLDSTEECLATAPVECLCMVCRKSDLCPHAAQA